MIRFGELPAPWSALAMMAEGRIGDFAIGLGTLALLNAGLAQSKNRRGLVWFLLSLPLGPIATLFIVLSDRLPRPDGEA